jgi:hypothetical protein
VSNIPNWNKATLRTNDKFAVDSPE